MHHRFLHFFSICFTAKPFSSKSYEKGASLGTKLLFVFSLKDLSFSKERSFCGVWGNAPTFLLIKQHATHSAPFVDLFVDQFLVHLKLLGKARNAHEFFRSSIDQLFGHADVIARKSRAATSAFRHRRPARGTFCSRVQVHPLRTDP